MDEMDEHKKGKSCAIDICRWSNAVVEYPRGEGDFHIFEQQSIGTLSKPFTVDRICHSSPSPSASFTSL